MKNTSYFFQRNSKNTIKLREITRELPDFCIDFFIGVENNTSPLTRLNYAYDLRIFFDFLVNWVGMFRNKKIHELSLQDLEKVTSLDIERFLSYTTHYENKGKVISNGERGKARKLAAIRTLFKYFFKRDLIKADVSTKVDMPKIHDKTIVRLEDDEVVKLLDIAESGDTLSPRQKAFHEHTEKRDTAILTLLLGTGIRVSECVGLNVKDIDFSTNGINITRKGGNQVVLYFSDEIKFALVEHLEARSTMKRLPKDEPALFVSLQCKRITPRAVQLLVKKYAQNASPLKKITPHKLRSTYGTALYRETKDIYIVADVLGHKDVNTTKRHYAAISDDIRRSVANKVKLREDNRDGYKNN